jgi:hypothetical protein
LSASRWRAWLALSASLSVHGLVLWSMPPAVTSTLQDNSQYFVQAWLQGLEPTTPAEPEEERRPLPTAVTAQLPVAGDAIPAHARLADASLPEGGRPGEVAVYEARDLDRFPRPLSALVLKVPDSIPAGRVRARVVISRTGQVLGIDVVDGPAAVSDAAKQLLTYSRFSPAMRNGRVVDGRTLIELAYTASPEG